MRISDWSSDVCSSDLKSNNPAEFVRKDAQRPPKGIIHLRHRCDHCFCLSLKRHASPPGRRLRTVPPTAPVPRRLRPHSTQCAWPAYPIRSEEHTSELQSLMRISYAVFCLKKNIIHPDASPLLHVHITSIT